MYRSIFAQQAEFCVNESLSALMCLLTPESRLYGGALIFFLSIFMVPELQSSKICMYI